MNLIKKKPTTPSSRGLIQLNNNELKKKPFIKFKIVGSKTSSGRNNNGKMYEHCCLTNLGA